jgi:hypothetical protein
MTVRLVVHEFRLGDVDDPDIYAAEPIWQWQQSDAGQWVMANAVEPPVWFQGADMDTLMYKYRIVAEFSEQNAVFYQLKYGHQHR